MIKYCHSLISYKMSWSTEPIQQCNSAHVGYRYLETHNARETYTHWLFQQVLVKVKTTFLHKSKSAGPPLAHTHTNTHTRAQIFCRYSSKEFTLVPSVYCAVLSVTHANCVMVTGEAFQLVSQTSTEKEMSRKTRRRK